MEMLSDMGSIPIISTIRKREAFCLSFCVSVKLKGNRTHNGLGDLARRSASSAKTEPRQVPGQDRSPEEPKGAPGVAVYGRFPSVGI